MSRKSRRLRKQASRCAYLRSARRRSARPPRRWAVEVQRSSLARENLSDLLGGLGFELTDGKNFPVFSGDEFEDLSVAQDVFELAKRVRTAIKDTTALDPEFSLGSVIDMWTPNQAGHAFLEPQSGVIRITGGNVKLTVGPPSGLTKRELKRWQAQQDQRQYENQLERQRAQLEPAFNSEEAAKVIELLSREQHDGVTIFKMYELMEGHPSNRKIFHQQYSISQTDFDRFQDAVHNPAVSGDEARHAYSKPPKTPDPMTIAEAESFVRNLANVWLAGHRST